MAVVVPWPAPSADPARLLFDEETDCLEPAPRQIDPGPTPLDGRKAVLDVLVLLDGASDADGRTAVRDAAAAYAPAGVSLRARFGRVRVPADGTTVGYDDRRLFTASTTSAMRVAKAAVGGKRPAGIDVVYLLTNKELYLGDDAPDDGGRSYAVAGLADCIGGVAFAHRAFAVGERLSIGEPNETIHLAERLPGKILAHELGHLLGAHHHYANCAENVPSAVASSSTDVCTLMFNDVSLVSFRFSTVNRSIVRGHALVYAR